MRGRAIGLGMGAFSLGQVIGVPVGGLIAGLATWRWEFAVLKACALPLLAVIFYSVLRHTQKVGTKQFAGPGLPLLSVWKNGPISLTFFMTFLFNAASFASYTFLGTTLANTFSLSTAQLGMLGVLVGGGSLVGSLAGGALNDRQNAGHAFSAGVGSSCAIALGVAVLVVMTSHTLVTSLVALTIWFATSGVFITTQQTALSRMASDMRATALSWNTSVMHAGAATGVMLISSCLDWGLPISVVPTALSIACAATGVCMSRRLPRSSRRSND